MSSSLSLRKGLHAPSRPGQPRATTVESEALLLEWTAPGASGGHAICGYRVDVRTGGDGDFVVCLAHTRDPEPRYRLDGFTPMTWYEFRVAAINAAEKTGPPSVPSEPVLTRTAANLIGTVGFGAGALGHHVDGAAAPSRPGGRGGRRRRTKQPEGELLLAAERETHEAMKGREAAVAAEIERSMVSMATWDKVFRVRHGRSPRAEDRDESRVLRDEAHQQV
jgi:hypothetical protein